MSSGSSVSGRPQPVPWSVADAALATGLVFAAFFVVWVLIDPIAGALDDDTLLLPWFLAVLEGFMLIAVWAFAVKKYAIPWRLLGLRRPDGRALVLPVVALLGSLSFAAVYFGVLTGLGIDLTDSSQLPEDAFGDGAVRLLNMAIVAGWAPFTEEVFFRGFVLASLLPSLGAVRAATVSSVVFAGAHMLPVAMIPLFVTSLLLSWLYIRTRSIWPPVAAHAAQNLLAASMV